MRSVGAGEPFERLLTRAGLQEALLPISHAELFDLLDVDGSGELDARELLVGLALLLADRLSDLGELTLLFQAFDAGKAGALGREELRALLAALGLPRLTHIAAEVREEEARVEALFAALDCNGDGRVTLDELVRGLEAQPLLRQALRGDFAAEMDEGWWAWVKRRLGREAGEAQQGAVSASGKEN